MISRTIGVYNMEVKSAVNYNDYDIHLVIIFHLMCARVCKECTSTSNKAATGAMPARTRDNRRALVKKPANGEN